MTSWTEERVEALKRRFQAGESFAVIARGLGGGISRSACIGKAARLGLERCRDQGEFHRVASKVATRHHDSLLRPALIRRPIDRLSVAAPIRDTG